MKRASRLRVGAKVKARNGQGLDSWRPMLETQGLGGVFENSKMDWIQGCAFRQAQCPRMNTLDFKKLDIE
jgi:hypothetical protein